MNPEAEKITIIEGPPPTFEQLSHEWLLGLAEGAVPYRTALTRLRTFNGPALVERCYRAWKNRRPAFLEYRSEEGQLDQALILAARHLDLDEGQALWLWVRLPRGVESEIDWGEESSDAEGPTGSES
jgi:hypothetical protein